MTLTSKTKLLAAMCLSALGLDFSPLPVPQCGGGCRKPTKENKERNREKNRKAQKKAKKRGRRK